VYESAAIVVKEGGENEASEEPGTDEIETETVVGREKKTETPESINPVDRLREKLKKALAAERYEEAARIRDELKRFESGN
jgi:protein-arginine kinase activator protein McsA